MHDMTANKCVLKKIQESILHKKVFIHHLRLKDKVYCLSKSYFLNLNRHVINLTQDLKHW